MAPVTHPHHTKTEATSMMEVFQRPTPRTSQQPTATISTRGWISLNQAAYTAMGSPAAVELLFDRAEQIVGLRPAAQSLLHAFPVRSQRSTDTVIISAHGFLRNYSIDNSTSLRRSAWMDDGVLCVDIKEPGRVVTSNRAAS